MNIVNIYGLYVLGFFVFCILSYLFMLFFDDIIDFIGLGKLADRWEERLRLKHSHNYNLRKEK